MPQHADALKKWRAPACMLLLFALNCRIAWQLFKIEYLAYPESIEGCFIALAKIMRDHPFQWGWFPFWAGGMPFENTYAPLTHMIVAVLSAISGWSPARSFHVAAATIFALVPVSMFWMALHFSRKLGPSLIAALGYSFFSLSPLLFPTIGKDAGNFLNLRRLQVLVYYGEVPHTFALALLPVAAVCFHRALTETGMKWKVLAGVSSAALVLTNAFGLVSLVLMLIPLVLAFRRANRWSSVLILGSIGAISYAWVSPWLSPHVIRAIIANSPTAGGDFRYNSSSWLAVALVLIGFVLLFYLLRRFAAPEHVTFFVLAAYMPAAVVALWQFTGISLLAQPHRYHLEVDLLLPLAIVFAMYSMRSRLPLYARRGLPVILLTALTVQGYNCMRYARSFVRGADPNQFVEYKIARWMNENRPGERAFISGSSSSLYNVFTDNPQLHGAQEPTIPNAFTIIASYVIYRGVNAGPHDAEYSILWLKALGAHAVSVSGPNGREFYKPFANPRKFEGMLPVLWRDGDDVIYEVPARSKSLAHVVPIPAVPQRTLIHGLDIAPIQAYVAALDDPALPLATLEWKGLSRAVITAAVAPGQTISVQATYDPGWEAYSGSLRLPVRKDAIGQIVIDPPHPGPLEIDLIYTGGTWRLATRGASLLAMLITVTLILLGRFRDRLRHVRYAVSPHPSQL